MALLLTGIACSLFAFLAASILQLQLPFWLYFTGLHRTGTEKKSKIDIHGLRKALSILLYILGGCFLCGVMLLFCKVTSEAQTMLYYFIVIALAFNGIYFSYRKFDHNTYDDTVHLSSRIFLVAVNILFVLLCVISIR